MLLRPDNESAAKYLGSLELRTTLTQRYNAFSRMNTDEKMEIIQIKMNNILPKITPVITGTNNFSEIIAIPELTIGVWFRKQNNEEADVFAKLFAEDIPKPIIADEKTEENTDIYYQNFLKNNDKKTEPISSDAIKPQTHKQDENDNDIKTKFLFTCPTNIVLDLEGTDPQKPIDFVHIKEQFLQTYNENIKKFIYNIISHYFTDIDLQNDFIEMRTTEIFDEEREELTENTNFGQF